MVHLSPFFYFAFSLVPSLVFSCRFTGTPAAIKRRERTGWTIAMTKKAHARDNRQINFVIVRTMVQRKINISRETTNQSSSEAQLKINYEFLALKLELKVSA